MYCSYSSDQFSWLLKYYYWLSPVRYIPAFRNLKAVLNDCLRDRKQKAKANQVNTVCNGQSKLLMSNLSPYEHDFVIAKWKHEWKHEGFIILSCDKSLLSDDSTVYSYREIKVYFTHPSCTNSKILLKFQLQENCVLDLLVAACEENGDQSLSDDEILSHCINFLFAAYDTTSLTLACASHLLATNTHVQDKLCGLLDDYWSQHQV